VGNAKLERGGRYTVEGSFVTCSWRKKKGQSRSSRPHKRKGPGANGEKGLKNTKETQQVVKRAR